MIAETPAIAAVARGPSTPSARILVVDDEPANIQLVGSVLGKFGHEIIPATDGETALRRVALRTPDLVLLDLLLPGMDGCEICRRLQENPEWKEIPVIFLSSADDKALVVRALEAGGVDYVTRPFHAGELASRVRTQLSLKWARDREARLAEDKDELLGILAHDLKSHLGGLKMSAQLLQERLGPDGEVPVRQLADNILRSSDQVLGFIKEFLANAAADHGLSLRPGRCNLSDAAAVTVREYRPVGERKQLTFQAALSRQDTTVWADAGALSQVLDNLVSNAVKFSPPGKTISVSVRPLRTWVECQVQDQGPGFAPEDVPRLFQRYARLSAKPTGGEPSTGLGLSIVHKLVRAMNGELDWEAVPGGGSVFTVRLPQPANALED